MQSPWCTAVFLLETSGEVLAVSELITQCCSSPSLMGSHKRVSSLTDAEQDTSDIQMASLQISVLDIQGDFLSSLCLLRAPAWRAIPLCFAGSSLQRERWLSLCKSQHPSFYITCNLSSQMIFCSRPGDRVHFLLEEAAKPFFCT